MIISIKTSDIEKTPIEDLIPKNEIMVLCDKVMFPFLNRCLNLYGHKAYILENFKDGTYGISIKKLK